MSILQKDKYKNTLIFNKESIKLFYILNKKINENDCIYNCSCVFDVSCTSRGLNVFYIASMAETKRHLMASRKFLHLITLYPKPIHHYYRSVLTIPRNYSYKTDFLNYIKDKSIDKKLYLDHTPTTRFETFLINNRLLDQLWFRENNNNIKFYENNHKFSPIQLKYESFIASGVWEFPFDKKLTRDQYFYAKQQPILLTMMTCVQRNLILKSYYHDKLKCLFVDIPYANNEYSMLIIKPDELLNNDQLLEFCAKHFSEGQIILNFYHLHGRFTKYPKMILPKFHIKSEYHLDQEFLPVGKQKLYRKNCNYLIPLFGKTLPNFSQISDNLKGKEVRLSCHTEFICDEYGILPPPPTSKIINNSDDDDNNIKSENDKKENKKIVSYFNKSPLLINKNFIFAIMRAKDARFIALGIFEGDQTMMTNGVCLSPLDTLTVA